MNICIVSLYSFLLGDYNDDGRASKLISAFGSNHSITMLTSNFNHRSKEYYVNPPKYIKDVEYEYIPVGQYKKNLSIRRIVSHLQFAFGVKSYLKKTERKYDLIYCFVPSSAAVVAISDYAHRNNAKMVVDVLDIWPDSLLPIMKYKKLIKLLLYPWFCLSKKSYKLADYISAESVQYAKIAHAANPTVPWSYTYLGIDVDRIEQLINESNVKVDREPGQIILCYGGNLGNSYDFDSIIKALILLKNKNVNYKMYFVGGGDKQSYITEQIQENKLNAIVTGKVVYSDYLKYLSLCDIAFNSFLPNTKVVHSYKFNDYCATGLFVINSLSGETEDVIKRYKNGLSYKENELPEVLLEVCENWDTKYKLWKKHNYDCVKDLLDSKAIYKRLVQDINIRLFNNEVPL